MLRFLVLLSLLVSATLSFAQVNPWPWHKPLETKAEVISNGIQAMAINQGNSKVVVVVFGKKPSPAYDAVLTEVPGLLPDIIGHGENKGPVLRFELKKKDGGVITHQIEKLFAVAKEIKTNSNTLWVTFEEDKAILLDVISP